MINIVNLVNPQFDFKDWSITNCKKNFFELILKEVTSLLPSLLILNFGLCSFDIIVIIRSPCVSRQNTVE